MYIWSNIVDVQLPNPLNLQRHPNPEMQFLLRGASVHDDDNYNDDDILTIPVFKKPGEKFDDSSF